MNSLEKLTKIYPLSKTLRFRLIPVGETLNAIYKNGVLDNDEQRSIDYDIVKEYIDRYHKKFILEALADFTFSDDIKNYASLYLKKNRTKEESDELGKITNSLKTQLGNHFKKQEEFEKLFKSELITELLPKYLTDNSELKILEKFSKFTTYFVGFNENRKRYNLSFLEFFLLWIAKHFDETSWHIIISIN